MGEVGVQTGLAEWLLACIAEPEHPRLWDRFSTEGFDEHIVTWNPRRVLVECDTKRRIIETYQGALFTQECHPEYEDNNGYVKALADVLRLMAVVYKDRPGYVEAWAPDGR